MSEYKTISDLGGCPEEGCPLYQWCEVFMNIPPESYPEGACCRFKEETTIENAIDFLINRDKVYQREIEEEEIAEEKKRIKREKAKKTRLKNREKNAEKKRLRKRTRIIQNIGITEEHFDLLVRGKKLRGTIILLLGLCASDKTQPFVDELNEVNAKIEKILKGKK